MPIFADYLLVQMFAFLLIFCRLGAALMVMPGFGEIFVSPRARLLIALTISLVITPLLQNNMPAIPESTSVLVLLIAKEITIGVFLGMLMRTLISSMHVASTILATQSGLANAMMFDLTMSGQTTAVSNMLTFAGLVLVFAADLHHVMLLAIVDSYQLLPVVGVLQTQDMAFTTASYVSKAFLIALQLSSPFIAISLVLNLGGGVLGRLMPTFQVFFVLMAPQIGIAFLVLLISLPAILLWYLSFVESGLTNLLNSL
jgi:flagellar biosynthetic protein FliR